MDPAGAPQSHCKPVVHPSNPNEYSATTHGTAEGEIRGVIPVKLEAADGTAVESVAEVPLKLKSGLFWSQVVSVLLYNVECWPMRKNNIDAAEGFIYRCLCHVTRVA